MNAAERDEQTALCQRLRAESPEYTIGRAAFTREGNDAACPYPAGNDRLAWFLGFLDARTSARLHFYPWP